jgi:hypothetical protein
MNPVSTAGPASMMATPSAPPAALPFEPPLAESGACCELHPIASDRTRQEPHLPILPRTSLIVTPRAVERKG